MLFMSSETIESTQERILLRRFRDNLTPKYAAASATAVNGIPIRRSCEKLPTRFHWCRQRRIISRSTFCSKVNSGTGYRHLPNTCEHWYLPVLFFPCSLHLWHHEAGAPIVITHAWVRFSFLGRLQFPFQSSLLLLYSDALEYDLEKTE